MSGDEAKLRRYLEKVTVDLRKANRRVGDLERQAQEPIAIVGMSCRYPGGVDSPQGLWSLVREGGDAIADFPADRGWDLERLYHPDPDVPGTCYTRHGGFLADAGEFDAGFFGIAPREALAMDPQQRLLLEAGWEALEDARIDPHSLRKAQVGTFAGVMNQDYGEAPGMTTSVVSGRVAYTLGLEGPAITVDTACSSSLVALHLVSQALRGGECSLALAGGVTVLATPSGLIYFSRQRGLAPDGRCKSFAEAADGVGWSEGVGVLVLERLSDAQRNGHQILATIKASAVNQDGASNGITAPNGPSQERVIRQALANAGLEPADVDVVEAHGTGTTLGDPIEAGALLATYGQDRTEPLKLGSIKSNIGHTQAAAGVAGVIKMVMAMREGALPKTLHLDSPSSKVDWEAGQIELLGEQVPWQGGERPRRAGVSSFGIAGTNAHLILEEAPSAEPAEETPEGATGAGKGGGATRPLPGPVPLVVSAKTEPALREAAGRLAAHLQANPELDPTDVAYSLATTRPRFEQRAVVVGAERAELLSGLGAVERGEAAAGAVEGRARPAAKLAYLFTGQGSQRVGMGSELYESNSAFGDAFDQACAQLDPHLDVPLAQVVFGKGEEAARLLDDTTYAQPALFALQVALYEALRSQGLAPDLLAGHSIGEVSAAHVAGVFSLADAAKLVAARGRLMGALPEGGAMLAIQAGEDEAAEAIRGQEQELAIAAINAPDSTVLSGALAAIEAAQADWERKGRKTKRLAVSHAFHSPLIEPMLEEFETVARGVELREPAIPVVSNLTGETLGAEQATDPAYWVRHAREPVRFMDGTHTLLSRGATAFLELGPDPVLCAMAERCLEGGEGREEPPALIPTLREGRPEPESFSSALAHAHAAGAGVEWEALFAGTGAKGVALPTYPFQRKRYWLNASARSGGAGAVGQADPDHPLLGASIFPPEGEGLLLSGRLSLQAHPWLADHAISGAVLLPGAAFVELASRAGAEVGLGTIEELTLQAPLILPESGAVQLQLTVSAPDGEGAREVAIHSRPEGGEEEWARHAHGTLTSAAPALSELPASWPPEGAEPLDVDSLRERLADAGLECGPALQGLAAAWRVGEEVYAEVSLPEPAPEAERYGIHPALLEAALHGIALLPGEESTDLQLPFAWRGVSLRSPGAGGLRVRISPAQDGTSLDIADEAGTPVAILASVETRPVEASELSASARRSLYELEWSAVTPPAANGAEPLRLAILGEAEAGIAAATRYPDLTALQAAVADGAGAPEVVLVDARLAPVGEGTLEAAHATAWQALELLEAWVAGPFGATRLAFLTEGAVAADAGEDPKLAAAPLVGLLRSACSEHPGRFALVDSDGAGSSEEALPAALRLQEEPEIALRDGRALVPRLARPEAADEQQAAAIDPDSTVLITGGTGGIGALVARHLVAEHGVRRLLLASRSGSEAEGAGELAGSLEDLGCEVEIAACDVADRDRLAELIDSIPAQHPLGAVVHSAGVLDDGVLESLDRERLERVMRPKVDAAWHLHELTEGIPLSQFLLFSSAAGILGGAAQANYAAANAFLDALAQHRRANGLPATSLAWGLWSPGGESAEEIDAGAARFVQQIRTRLGFAPMSAGQGLELFDLARASGGALRVPVAFDGAALRAQADAGTLPAVLRGLVRAGGRRTRAGEALAQRLARVPEAEREAFVLGLVRAEVAVVLGHASAEDVETDKSFKDLGFDSLAAIELRNRLAGITGLSPPATLVFDYPTVAELAGFVLAAARGGDRETEAPVRASLSDEPIAIVGMSCRYPGGVGSPRELWELLSAGGDAIAGFPTDRGWDRERLYDPDPDRHGTSYVREGGFLPGAVEFDAGFFGIGPREALAMDPQQRLLLEISWEALEDAGFDPQALRGSRTGVFAGIGTSDYGLGFGGHDWLESFAGTGLSPSVASGRIAYALGLSGPAISVDTACSSSLVAMHLAVQALRTGECSYALAGGVTVMSSPSVFVFSSRQRAVAPDGRSKSFAEGADGTGFSEGVGMVVLERLSEAERQGHPVLALIRGSATNQDGASNGLAAPNGLAQERVIRQALANAGLEAADVDAVEAHGTGTALGDPIEAGALLATYGRDRDEPVRLGSIKSNIGHTQSAAGVAGVIKMVMAMREGLLPKTLHVDRPSSEIEWSAGEVELLTEAKPWESNGRPRRAGVSSFGMSGTNAHLILEEAPAVPEEEGGGDDPGPGEAEPALRGPVPLVLSAKSEPALREAAARLHSHLDENPDLDPSDVAYSLATGRSGFDHHAVALGSDREQLLDSLHALGVGADGPGYCAGVARAGRQPIFLFPGHGSQWRGMALELLESSAPFARKMRECQEALEPHLEWSFETILRGEAPMPPERADIVQPMLFAMMVSLAELWRRCGVEPAAVVGQSQGEIAAAHVAGGLSLADAARAVALRSKVLMQLTGRGKMISVGLGAEALDSRLERWGGRIEVAALTGPSSAVLSGERDALDELMRECAEAGVRAKDIPGAVGASHSVYVEMLREELLAELAPIAPRSGEIPFYSTVAGELIDTAGLDAEYWYRNARQTVLLEPVVRSLLGAGPRTLIEVSPHPVLAIGLQEAVERAGAGEAAVLSTLRRDEGGAERFALSLAEAQVAGTEIEWEAFFSGAGTKRAPLPTYPFQRKRYWLEAVSAGGDVSRAGLTAPEHPLLGAVVDSPGDDGLRLTGRVALATHRWLSDHALHGTTLVPGAVLVDLALSAGREAGAGAIDELTLEEPLTLAEAGATQLSVTVGAPDGEGGRSVAVHSRPERPAGEEEDWNRNAAGRLRPQPSSDEAPPDPLFASPWPPEAAEPLDVESAYDQLAAAGFDLGHAFQGLRGAWREGEDLLVEVGLEDEQAGDAERFSLHPALLEAATFPWAGGARPFSWRGLRLHRRGATALRALIRTGEKGSSLLAVDETGAPLVSVEAMGERSLRPSELGASRRPLYRVEWAAPPQASPGDSPRQAPPELVLAEASVPARAAGSPPERAEAAVRDASEQLQAWIAAGPPAGTRFALLTHSAVATGPDESPDLASAPLWGLLRSAQAEYPGRVCVIDTDGSDASKAALGTALALAMEEPQIALREGIALVPRLARVRGDARVPAAFDPDATVLLLVGPGGEAEDRVTELKAELAELGARTTVVACDLADRAQLEEVLAALPDERPLGAIVLAVEGDGAVDGAWHLHELTEGRELSHFVLVSAAAGTLGGVGEAARAAAAGFLDALAAHRHAQGLPATSIARESGQGSGDLRAALAAGEPLAIPLELDRAALRVSAREGSLPPILRGLVPRPAQHALQPGSLRQRLAAAPQEAREGVALDLVRAEMAALLGHSSAEDVDPELVFQEMGVDSLAAVELCKRLESSTGVPVPILALTNHRTPRSLAGHLLGQLEGSAAGGAAGETSFVSLLGRAREQETLDDFVELLSSASRFRPSFESPSDGGRPGLVRLCEGSESPSLVLIPSAGPMSGPHEYVRFAREFHGERSVFAAPLPGFVAGERLPAGLEALVEMQAEAIRRSDVGEGFALGGHSSGGWIAHALGGHLEAIGIRPAAVVLLDSYWPQTELLGQIVPMILAAANDAGADVGIDDVRLTAMGGYRRIFAPWRPEELVVPTVMVRADRPALELAHVEGDGWQASWRLPHAVVDVPGDHMTMMQEHAGSTAEAVRNVLEQAADSPIEKGTVTVRGANPQ